MVNILNQYPDLIDPILRTYNHVKPYLPTLSPSQYNFYKEIHLPTAQKNISIAEIS